MPDTFDREKCKQRNRLAARAGVEAAPITFLQGAPAAVEPAKLLSARGTLPVDDEAALDRINARLPDGADPLTLDRIYLYYAEAANNSFIPGHSIFLDSATLRNIATNAEEGFAFMNSHRTGGLSHPAELPFGRTFAGRFERWVGAGGEIDERAIVGIYMLKNQRPNGAMGPSTDDLHAGINAGTISDVSVGLRGGGRECFCGADMDEMSSCKHVPGTTIGMTDEDMDAQRDRGVPGGVATYTVCGARCGEVSAVFSGAVTGAGFRKAMAFARDHKLSRQDLAAVRKAYGPLLKSGDLPEPNPSPGRKAMGLKVSAMKLFGLWSDQGQAEEVDLSSLVTPPEHDTMSPAIQPPADNTAELAALRNELAAKDAELAKIAEAHLAFEEKVKARAAADLEASFARDAESFAQDAMKERNLFCPVSKGPLVILLAQLARDDHANPVNLGPKDMPDSPVGRARALQVFVDSLSPHNLLGRPLSQGSLPEGSGVLEVNQGPPRNSVADPKKVDESLAMTETGRRALEIRNGKK